ncbi:MAG: hypothetical protein DRN57_08090 [Thermoplasmata archaeon]|nr:MAG: hypothetical protein DRN57_08090 [Thermoplasmata archaeon]
MEKADKVTIRLTPDQAQGLDLLVREGRFRNRSEAIRSSIDMLLAGPEEEDPGVVKVRLSDTVRSAIEVLISMEHFVNMELGVRELIRNGLDQIDINKLKARQDLLAELGAERTAKDLLEAQYRNMLKE